MLVYISNTYAPEAGAAYSAAVLADNPSAYWKFRDGNSNDFRNYASTGVPAANYSTFFDRNSVISGLHPSLPADWTVECWFNTRSSSRQTLFSFVANPRGASGMDLFIVPGNNQIGIDNGVSGTDGFSAVIPMNVWNHIAYVKSGANVSCFLNGVRVGTIAFSPNPISYVYIGALSLDLGGGNYLAFNGLMYNVRVTNGTALYSSPFTKPNGLLSPVAGTTLATCVGPTVTDTSSNNVLLTSPTPFKVVPFYGTPFMSNVGANNTYVDSSVTTPTPLSAPLGAVNQIYFGQPPLAPGLGASYFMPFNTPLSVNNGSTMLPTPKLDTTISGANTFEFWFDFNNTLIDSGNGYIFSIGNLSVYVASAPPQSLMTIAVSMYSPDTQQSYNRSYTITPGVHYIVFTYDHYLSGTMYIDGMPAAPFIPVGVSSIPMPSPLVLGLYHSGTSATSGYDQNLQAYQGRISDFAFYGHELPYSSIWSHYQIGMGRQTYSVTPYQSVVLADSPVSYWPMNDDPYTNATRDKAYNLTSADNRLASGSFVYWNDYTNDPMPLQLTDSNLDGKVTFNAPALTSALGNSFTLGVPSTGALSSETLATIGVLAGNFAGFPKYKKFETAFAASNSTGFCVEMWFSHNQPQSTPYGNLFWISFAHGLCARIHLPNASSVIGTIEVIYNNTVIYTAGLVAPSTVYHMVATLSTNGSKLYLNGNLVGSSSTKWVATGSGYPAPLDFTSQTFIMGTQLVGTISNPAVYAYELTAGQVLAHYNAGK
jgi:hypothetical protein